MGRVAELGSLGRFMITLLQTTNLLADSLWWVVLITFCFVVYHCYRLAALPT